jgi:hypothetical protein
MKRISKIACVIAILATFATPFSVFSANDVSTHSTLPTNLVSYWTLDESSTGVGDVQRNDSVTTNHLVDNNSTASAVGKQSNGADFELANTEYLRKTDNASLSITSDVSLAAWVKFETAPGAGTYFVFASKYTSGTSRNLYWDMDQTTIRFGIGNGSGVGSGDSECTKSWSPSAGTWYHVAVTYSNSANEQKIYIDGSQLGTTCGSANFSMADGTSPFEVGRRGDGAGYFDGIIDEMGLWSKTLTSTEITDLYNSGSGIPYIASATPEATMYPSSYFSGNVFMGGSVNIR